ncbi:CinA family protein [Candidatus Persebacteraceae bacterium Df01]|jgi:nicotinamide-nucleotide amidase|uniref:CinA family protein n=1 Tax=Candidatus Doriopsillibacter californiensis TaxID=2970740 RepID=A0ABT7QMB8_9GAMM|nr:CinA family protein [Candidatus Persebacteraceae bacterium Df01]
MNVELFELSRTIGELAQRQHIKVATAESCTGGLLAATLTHWSGASAWFECGVIAYTNEAKKQLLAVPEDILSMHGAVSEPVAAAMCAGVESDAVLSITGIAGPTGGSAEKPVGTVCFGWQFMDETHTATRSFSGNREAVRIAAAIHALLTMVKWLREVESKVL